MITKPLLSAVATLAFLGPACGAEVEEPTPTARLTLTIPEGVVNPIPGVDGNLPQVTIDGHYVHVVSFERCVGSCAELTVGETPLFDLADDGSSSVESSWQAGREVEWTEGRAWREPPRLTGTIVYGVPPASDVRNLYVAPLVMGARYLVRAERMGPCNDHAPNCAHMDAVGAAYFTMEPGVSVSFDMIETPYDD